MEYALIYTVIGILIGIILFLKLIFEKVKD